MGAPFFAKEVVLREAARRRTLPGRASLGLFLMLYRTTLDSLSRVFFLMRYEGGSTALVFGFSTTFVGRESQVLKSEDLG